MRYWNARIPAFIVTTMTRTAQDDFPQTLNTWLCEQIDKTNADVGKVNRHVMEAYHAPLKAYLLCTSWRRSGEPDEIINGFLADRLDREDFFAKWRASGLRLRRWLVNALHFYLKEQWRRERRHDAEPIEDQEPDHIDDQVDRAWARSLVTAACKDAHESCVADDLEGHWQLFVRHHVDGVPYDRCAAEFDVDPKRCAVMVRTATSRFRAALKARLQADNVGPDQLDAELLHLQEVLS